MFALPALRPINAQKLSDRMRVKLFLGVEVFIEAAASQASVPHDLVDRDLSETLAIKEPARAVNDALAGFLFMSR